MTLLIIQLALLLLLAAAVGLFVGWQVQRQRGEVQLAELDAKANRVCHEHAERAEEAVAELDATNESLGSIRADYKQASRRLRNLTGALSDSESTIAGLEADVSALREQLESATQEYAGREQALREVIASHHSEEASRQNEEQASDMANELATATGRIADLETTLEDRDSAIAALRALIDNRDATINQLREQGSADDSAAIREQLGKARRAAATYEAEAEKAHARRQSGEAAAAQQIARLQAELDRVRPQSDALQGELADARTQLAAMREQAQRLRDELANESGQRAALEQKYEALAARADSDDLKRIKGIGPVLEKSLKAHGITRFSQIAALDANDIETISASLQTFPDRIRRDRWVEQAAELAEEREPQSA